MKCAVCLCMLRGTFVSWWYLPRIWPSVTDTQHYCHARYPTDDWHLAYMFSLVYFSVEVCLVGVFSYSVSTWRDPCVRVYVPLTLPPLSREKKIEGVTRISTWAKRGGIWTDAWVCLHYWVEIWVPGYFNFPYIAQSWDVSQAGYIMALRSYCVLDMLLPPIIIMIKDCSQAFSTCKCL